VYSQTAIYLQYGKQIKMFFQRLKLIYAKGKQGEQDVNHRLNLHKSFVCTTYRTITVLSEKKFADADLFGRTPEIFWQDKKGFIFFRSCLFLSAVKGLSASEEYNRYRK